MQVKDGLITHFPDMSSVTQSFPNLNGFGLTFTKLKFIQRSQLTSLSKLKFFLISDNEIEVIPPDTFLDMTQIELIDICRNNVHLLELQWISTMPNLKVFKARSNKFEVIPQDFFVNNPNVEEILLDFNQIVYNYCDFHELKNIKTLSLLGNKCIDLMYCKDANESKCIKSFQQFSYIVYGQCSKFEDD